MPKSGFSSYSRVCKRCGNTYHTKYKFSRCCTDCYKPHPFGCEQLSKRKDKVNHWGRTDVKV